MKPRLVASNKTPDERVKQCGELIQKALEDNGCQMFTALKVGNAETPLTEIAGLPIVIVVRANASET